MGDQLQVLDQVRSTAIDLAMKFGPKLLVAVLILFAGNVAGRWAARMLASFRSRNIVMPYPQVEVRMLPAGG